MCSHQQKVQSVLWHGPAAGLSEAQGELNPIPGQRLKRIDAAGLGVRGASGENAP